MTDPTPLALPPPRIFRQQCRHEDGWSDHYGALHEAAEYAGLAMPERYRINAVWQHGCCGPWEATSPGPLVFNSPAAKRFPLFVAREEEAAFLQAHGYPQARAIGLPILYAPDPNLPRRPGTLLVMPTHTLVGAQFEDRAPFERYAAEIKSVAHRFARVLVCVHPACRQNGLWIREFTAQGFEVVDGAQTNDRHALRRMRALFAQCEYVTSNGWGSHIAYALAFGAKVSIWGTEIRNTAANVLRDASWAADRAALDALWSEEVQQKKRDCLQSLFRAPHDGLLDEAWGGRLIGAGHRLSPAAMAELLPAMVDPAPARALTADRTARRVLFVCHEATRTGAPMFLLHLLGWLRAHTDLVCDVLLARGGPLEGDFARVAAVRSAEDFARHPGALAGYRLIYANTVACAELVEKLPRGSVPVITHLHELDCGYEWAGARQLALGIRQSTRFIACAQAVADRFGARFLVPTERMVVHHEMVDAPRLAAVASTVDRRAVRRQFGLPPDARVVAGCGTADPRKGVDLFIQLALRLRRSITDGRPWRFVWIGSASSRNLQTLLEEDVRKLGLAGEVVFTGELAEPHPLLASADVFALTSREDPFPLAMLEAAAVGRPVVCFDGAGGGPEFCALGGGVSVPYLDIEAMSLACRDLLLDEVRRNALGERAALLVRDRFTLAAIGPAVWATMQTVMQEPGETAGYRLRALAEIFREWNPGHVPQRAYVEAHLARAAVREEARRLSGAGRPREALQQLVKAVNADLASKDPLIICESLLQIGEDLATYDGKQSAVLLERAATVARNARLDLDSLRLGQAA